MSKENNYAQLRIRLKYVGLIPYSVLPHERGAIVSAKESWSLDSELGAGDIVAGAVADPRKWKDPPHVAFANLNLDSAGICRFTRQYGAILGSGKSVSEGWDGRIE